MSERVALYLQDAHDLRDGLDYAKYAEEHGFEAVWQAESRLVRDAIVPMAAYAAVTEEWAAASPRHRELLATVRAEIAKLRQRK